MKKVFTILAVVIATQFGFSQEDAFKKDAAKLIEASGTAVHFDMVLDQIKTMVPEDKHQELTEDFNSTLPDLYAKIAEVYTEEFTHDDIKQMLAFYNSEIGKKLASKQKDIVERSAVAGEQWGLDLQMIMMKYME